MYELSQEQKKEVRGYRRLKAAGRLDEENPLDGHRVLMRCRIAALLALLHGALEVDEATWELSKLVTDRSCGLRDHLAGGVQRAQEAARKAKADHQVGIKVRASSIDEHRGRVRRAMESLIEKIEANGGEMTRGRARNAVAKSLRPETEEAIALAVDKGLLVEEDRGGTLRLSQDQD